MALTDAMLGLIGAAVIVYFTLYKNKTRWKRMIGATALIVIGVSLGVINDTPAMYVPAAMLLLVGGIRLVEDASEVAN